MQFSTPEQLSKPLQQARRELATTQEQLTQSLRDLQETRARRDRTNTGLADPQSEAGQRERARVLALGEDIKKCLLERDEARAKLEQAKIDMRAADHSACVELVESTRSDYMQHLRTFIIARLEAVEREAVAAAACFEIRNGLKLALGIERESRIARLPLAYDLPLAFERYERARRETVELIEAGVIQSKDCPAALRKVWKL